MNWNLLKAAAEFGVSRETIKRGLLAIGETVQPRKSWPTTTIVRAISGDGKVERARLTRAQADREEIEVARLRGELWDAAEVVAVLRHIYGKDREKIVTLPNAYAARCNSSDPEMAYRALQEFRDEYLKTTTEDTLQKAFESIRKQVVKEKPSKAKQEDADE